MVLYIGCRICGLPTYHMSGKRRILTAAFQIPISVLLVINSTTLIWTRSKIALTRQPAPQVRTCKTDAIAVLSSLAWHTQAAQETSLIPSPQMPQSPPWAGSAGVQVSAALVGILDRMSGHYCFFCPQKMPFCDLPTLWRKSKLSILQKWPNR